MHSHTNGHYRPNLRRIKLDPFEEALRHDPEWTKADSLSWLIVVIGGSMFWIGIVLAVALYWTE